jgi:alpha-L-rhamnosidase
MLEGWELDSRSYDHHYWGLISSWFYQGLAGIRPALPGYDKIVIRPAVPQGLERISAHLDTDRGRISSSWTQAGGNLTLSVGVPGGAEAEVWCPGKVLRPALGSRLLRSDVAHEVYEVGAGTHQFVCAMGPS